MGCGNSKGAAPVKAGDKAKQLVMGRYDVVKGKKGLLGEGSFSVVQRGIDVQTGLEVAVKTYKLDGEDREETELALKKFRRQVQVLKMLQEPLVAPSDASLWHPDLQGIDPTKLFLTLLDYSKDENGEPAPDPDDGILYVVTEMAAFSLKDFLADRREEDIALPLSDVQAITRSILVVVAALHAKGMAHLDIKPENLMLVDQDWKLIDVDGCVALQSNVSITDASISFSPCYCAPEWARFLIEDQEVLQITPGLDVWSVGAAIAELVLLDAMLKGKYAEIFRDVGSHRKAGFLFLEWLSNPRGGIPIPKDIVKFDDNLTDLLKNHLLVQNSKKRNSLASCLSHPFVMAAAQKNVVDANKQAALKSKRQRRLEEPISGKPPIFNGMLFKLNSEGDANNPDHWLRRDMWLAANGSLCYFSQKENKRLVLIPAEKMSVAIVKEFDSKPQQFAFRLELPGNDDLDVQAEAVSFASPTAEDRSSWVACVAKVAEVALKDGGLQGLKMSRTMVRDFREFALRIKNRRTALGEDQKAEFEPVFKAELWKLNQDGDQMNGEHWLLREMWVAKNGSFCYFSKKEDKPLQYYTASDMRSISTKPLPAGATAKEFSFEVKLPPVDGLEYEPAIFAAVDEAGRKAWMKEITQTTKQ